ncbi:uncharacterized protein METZ01_LOCUS373922, partial [marine metagenome]
DMAYSNSRAGVPVSAGAPSDDGLPF